MLQLCAIACLTLQLASQQGTVAAGRSAAEVAEGRGLLQRLVEAQSKMAQMTAEYVQHRTTALTKKPLTSQGTLAFRRDPGCVVFLVREPRASTIRLEGTHYEVWHPDKARLERFILPSDEMPRLLFDALAPSKATVDTAFAIESCTKVDGAATQRLLTLVPTAAKTKRVAARITLTIDTEGPQLRGFGYQDPRGGDVRVALSALKMADKADDKLFTLDLPTDTKVVIQRVPEAKDAPSKDPAPTPRQADGKK